MSTENVHITQPVEIQNDAKARVAYDLMTYIARHEDVANSEKKSRDYWLKLYYQCHLAASGSDIKYVLARN